MPADAVGRELEPGSGCFVGFAGMAGRATALAFSLGVELRSGALKGFDLETSIGFDSARVASEVWPPGRETPDCHSTQDKDAQARRRTVASESQLRRIVVFMH